MADDWRRWLHAACVRVFFDRVTVRHRERLFARGPVLYLGLHRNGAIDGFIYDSVLPGAEFLISRQLRGNLLGRLFFAGIEVIRDKDRAAGEATADTNTAALEACLAHLRAGGSLCLFPEGTSSLGPRHLPFKSGAARLLAAALDDNIPVTVIPLSLHYECAWAFRSRVEMVVGPPVATDLPSGLTPPRRIVELKRRFATALEAVGINVESAARQIEIERLAHIATLATSRSYFAGLKALEKSTPPALEQAARAWDVGLEGRRLLRFQGVVLFPMKPVWIYAAALLIAGALAAPGAALNIVPLAAGAIAGKKLPDGPNVIALWKVLVGIPVLALWTFLVLLSAIVAGHPCWFFIHLVASGLSLGLWRRIKKLAVAVHNGLRHPELTIRVMAFREIVLKEVRDESA